MKRHLTRHITTCGLLALHLLLSACADDTGRQQPTASVQEAVAFEASVAQASPTRAKNMVNDEATLQSIYDGVGFGVFACYTGLYKYGDINVHPDFMYNQQVCYEATSSPPQWTYSPLKYWPNGEGEATGHTGEIPHYVSFMAYAPWSDNTTGNVGYCISSFSHQGDIGNPWLIYRLSREVENQVDLLYAPAQLDLLKPAQATRIPFVFGHALACVGDNVTIICSPGLQSQLKGRVNGVTIKQAKVQVTSLVIKYTLTSKARLVLWSQDGKANWQTILSEDPTTTRTVNIVSPDDPKDIHIYDITNGSTEEAHTISFSPYTVSGEGVYYIPVELTGHPQTVQVSLAYQVMTNSGAEEARWINVIENEASATLTLSSYEEAYQPGKHLFINITLSPMDIALTAAIAPWTVVTKDVQGIEE